MSSAFALARLGADLAHTERVGRLLGWGRCGFLGQAFNDRL